VAIIPIKFSRSSKYVYPLRIKPYRLFPGVPTWTPLAEATLIIHFPVILSQMPLVEANLVIHFLESLSRMPLVKANLVIHFLAILSRMPLAKANLVIHFPPSLSRMPLAEANLINTLDFIYIEHNIIVIAFIMEILNCISIKERETTYLLRLSRDFLQ
jgi:hypothetical protein